VKDLANTIVSIEEDFAKIGGEVQKIDNLKILCDEQDEALTYAPRWNELHNEYTNLMAISRATANTAYGEIEKLLTVVMPITKGNFDVTRKDKALQSYIANLEKFDVEAQNHKKRFLRLRQSVEIFQTNLKSNVERQLGEVQTGLQKINTRIKGLQDKLDRTGGFRSFWQAVQLSGPKVGKPAEAALGVFTIFGGTTAIVGATAGLAALAVLSPAMAGLAALAPVIAVGILIVGFAAVGLALNRGYKEQAARRQLKEDRIPGLKKIKKEFEKQEAELQNALKSLTALDNTFADLITSLETMEGLWGMLITDAQRLKEKLGNIDQADDVLIAEMTASNVKAMYEALMEALDAYCLATKKGNK
jgi:septal ring factor EnvC (AmiA/AmiB activator)